MTLLSEHAEGGVEGFADRFVAKNGRGRLLAAWDFEEQSFPVDGETYYLYRVG